VVVHELRGRASSRRLSQEERSKMVTIVSDPAYAGFGSTLAADNTAASDVELQQIRQTLHRRNPLCELAADTVLSGGSPESSVTYGRPHWMQ